MAAKPHAVSAKDHLPLVFDPSEYLIFRVSEPFDRKSTCRLVVTNTSSMERFGFKMKCTAANHYGSDPATGIIEPKRSRTISVCLWEQPGRDLTQLDWRKHKFGISYFIVNNDCTENEIDRMIKRSTVQLKTALLKSMILREGDPIPYDLPSLSEQSLRPRFDTIRPSDDTPQVMILQAALVSTENEVESLKEELLIKESLVSAAIEKESQLRLELKQFSEENQRLEREKENARLLMDEMKVAHQRNIKDLSEEIQQLTKEKENVQLYVQEMRVAHKREVENFSREVEQLLKEKESIQLFSEEMRAAHQKETDAFSREMTKLEADYKLEIDDLTKTLKELELSTNNVSYWEVSHKVINTTTSELGRGAYGTVYSGYFMGQKVAVKCLHQSIKSSFYVAQLRREVALLAKVRHPNLLLFIVAAFDHPNGCPLIVTELMTTSLRKAYEESLLANKDKIHIMYDVACALHYLHSQSEPILHRDINSANVLLQELKDTWRGKISDFGSANLAKYATTSAPGAEIYTAPEIPRASVAADDGEPTQQQEQDSQKQTPKVDVYSYGILLCEIFAKEPSLPTVRDFPLMLKSVENEFTFMYEMIKRCIRREHTGRPSMHEILRDFRVTFSKIVT